MKKFDVFLIFAGCVALLACFFVFLKPQSITHIEPQNFDSIRQNYLENINQLNKKIDSIEKINLKIDHYESQQIHIIKRLPADSVYSRFARATDPK